MFLLFILLSLDYVCITMQLDQLYRMARQLHGKLNRDVVHDLYVKFGNDMPSDAYLITCINHAKTLPAQEIVDVTALDSHEDGEPSHDAAILAKAIRNVSVKYQLEVDTFLECCVNGTYASFAKHSEISITVLKKICKFAKLQIQNEYKRLC